MDTKFSTWKISKKNERMENESNSMLFSQKDVKKLFFIIGVGRSGTSLLQEIMNTFDGFCNEIESRILPKRISCYSAVIKHNDFSDLEYFSLKNWTRTYFIEKTPNSILCLPQLYEKFSHANYLFLERHPLKILLSQMNFHPPGSSNQKFREKWLEQGNVSKEDLELNFEHFKAKQLLKWIKAQVKSKQKFQNKITIRYENMVKNLESQLIIMKKTFKITPNINLAKQILSRPSKGSKHNSYMITSLTDQEAILLTKEACRLWNYDYDCVMNPLDFSTCEPIIKS